MNKRNNEFGFTLAELLVVVAIIAVLVAIAIPLFNAQIEKARLAADHAAVRNAYALVQLANNMEEIEVQNSSGEKKVYTFSELKKNLPVNLVWCLGADNNCFVDFAGSKDANVYTFKADGFEGDTVGGACSECRQWDKVSVSGSGINQQPSTSHKKDGKIYASFDRNNGKIYLGFMGTTN